MKNILKGGIFILALSVLTACNGNGDSGKADSVATNNDSSSATTTVDTLPITDTTNKADSTQN